LYRICVRSIQNLVDGSFSSHWDPLFKAHNHLSYSLYYPEILIGVISFAI